MFVSNAKQKLGSVQERSLKYSINKGLLSSGDGSHSTQLASGSGDNHTAITAWRRAELLLIHSNVITRKELPRPLAARESLIVFLFFAVAEITVSRNARCEGSSTVTVFSSGRPPSPPASPSTQAVSA